MSDSTGILQRLGRLGQTLEDMILVLLLGGMILLAAGQIVLRNVFDMGFPWTDELLRLLVLWLALAGAVAASRQDKHISIAVLDQLLPPRIRCLVQALTHLFTTTVCGFIAAYCFAFVRTSYEFGDVLMGQVPAWLLQSVLPLGFGLIAYRYFLFTCRDFLRALRRAPET